MAVEFRALSYRQSQLDERYDAIVVGSGAGGLTAAVLLAKHAGKRVVVLERHFTAGGFTHVFKRPGFEWDVGLHYIGQVGDPRSPVRRIFDYLTDGRLQWASMPDIYDRVIIGDKSFDFPTGMERFRERMKGYFPSDGRAVDRYLDAVNASVRWSNLFYVEKSLPPVLSASIGGLLRWPFLRYAGQTTFSVLSALTTNREQIAVLTGQWGDYGLPPMQSSFGIHATIAKHYFDGGSYPIGGAGAILASMGPIVANAGGAVLVNAEVDSILVEDDRAVGVEMIDGRHVLAPVVISDIGAENTYRRLIRANHPAVDRVRESLAAIPASVSHVCLYVGLDRTASELQLEGTNLWVYPGDDHDGNLERFFADPDSPLPSVYLSFPSAKDPSFERRFPGRATVTVITFVPYDWFTRWGETRWQNRGPDYDAFKVRLTTRLMEVLYRYAPATRGHVAHAELSTPLSTRRFTDHPHGEIYGLAHTPQRFALRALGPRTPIRNLYLTGQDAAVCGVTGAIAAGVMASSAVLRRNMFSVVTKERADQNR